MMENRMMEKWKYLLRNIAGVLLVITLTQAAAISRKSCEYNYYKVKGQQRCIECPKCSKGHGMNAKCRQYPPYEPHEILPKCVPCQDGLTYATHESSDVCNQCAEPCSSIDINRKETRTCTRFHNRLCGCTRGYFEGASGACNQQCCYCDQDYHYHQKCVSDNMPNDMSCRPTRHDGKCEKRTTPAPTSTSTKMTSSAQSQPTSNMPSSPTTHTTTPSVGTSTSSISSTSSEHERIIATTITTTPNRTISPTVARTTFGPLKIIILVIVVAIVVISLVVFIWCYRYRNPSGSLGSSEEEDGPSNLGLLFRQISGSGTHPYQKAPPTTSSMESTPTMSLRDFEVQRPHYATVGPFVKRLSFGERMKLAALLDKRETHNWLDIGMEIAGKDGTLVDDIKKCHQCYYGGGEQTLPIFKHLSTTNPDFTVSEFITISNELERLDVVSYVIQNGLLDGKFADISHYHLAKLGDILDKRVELNEGNYWPSFAEKFGLSCDDIEYFKQKIKEPRKYSPTYEMIMVLVARNPELTIERFQKAAVVVNRQDVKELLDDIIAGLKQ